MEYERKIKKVIESVYRKLGFLELESLNISHLGVGENNLNYLVTINQTNKFNFRIVMRKSFEKNMKKFMVR